MARRANARCALRMFCALRAAHLAEFTLTRNAQRADHAQCAARNANALRVINPKDSPDLLSIRRQLSGVVVFAPPKQRPHGARGRGGGGDAMIARLERDVQSPNEQIPQRERHLVLDRVVQLGDDVWERWYDWSRERDIASDDGPDGAP